jgi:hypothetical protein
VQLYLLKLECLFKWIRVPAIPFSRTQANGNQLFLRLDKSRRLDVSNLLQQSITALLDKVEMAAAVGLEPTTR